MRRRWGTGRVEATLTALGGRLGTTVGQTYTVVTGVVVALVLAMVGLPPVLRGLPGTTLAEALPLPAAADSAPAVEPAVPTPAPNTVPVQPAGPVTPQAPAVPVVDTPTPAGPATTVPTPEPMAEPHTVTVFAEIVGHGAVTALAWHDEILYAATDDGTTSSVIAIDREGDVVETWPVGQGGSAGVAVVDKTVTVIDAVGGRVRYLDTTTGRVDVGPRIPDVPACLLGVVPPPCEPGLVSSPPALSGIAAAPGGGVYVSDRGQGMVWKVDGGSVSVFAVFEDRLPGEGPTGVAVDRYGDLVVPASARLLALPIGAPALYIVPVVNGRAGTPRMMMELDGGSVPGGVAIGDSGRTYFTVPARNEVFDAGLDSGDRLAVAPGDVPFDQPVAVAVGDGHILVLDRGHQRDRSIVHAVTVHDQPVEQQR